MKVVRIIFGFILAGVLGFLAYQLYDQQQNKYSYLSFELDTPSTEIIIPDVDRLLRKIIEPQEIEYLALNETLTTGLSKTLDNGKANFNDILGKTCFLSFNNTDFVLGFNNVDLDFEQVSSLLDTVFKVKGIHTEGKYAIGDFKMFAEQYGTYTLFSTQPITAHQPDTVYLASNADYLVINDSLATERFILASGRSYRVWNETTLPVRGQPVLHSSFAQKIPASATVAYFYGSQRFSEDIQSFFIAPSEASFSWVDKGLMIIKNGDYELMVAPQNDTRNLRLMLEEQTLSLQADTAQLDFFSIKNFEIMPFETAFQWEQSIPELNSLLRYYTEYEAYNVMANSMEAMQWYLAAIQTGELYEENQNLMQDYLLSTTQKTHYLAVESIGSELAYQTKIWHNKTVCTRTQTKWAKYDLSTDAASNLVFEAPFAPTAIQPFGNGVKRNLLLSSKTELAVCNMENGVEWKLKLPGKLVLKPQLIDLENDGVNEFAVFTEKQFTVYSSTGKIKFKKVFTQLVKGGLCANYDNAYNYRFFIVTPVGVTCLNEQGKIVEGWTFTKSETALNGESFYTQINGIDFLTFKDVSNNLFVLNRKGENKFAKETATKLKNESVFVTGKNEDVLHKLGYSNQYIYNRYIKDGYTDSIKLDKRVNAVKAKWLMLDAPTLLVEEPNRVILFDAFGYVKQEILKPQEATRFLGLETTPEVRYVFFNNANNSLYLLNKDGKYVLSNLNNIQEVYGISAAYFYTFDGKQIEEHKLKQTL